MERIFSQPQNLSYKAGEKSKFRNTRKHVFGSYKYEVFWN